MTHRSTIKLALDGAALPTEFRLFQKGWNDTEKGRYLFDEEAANAVMTHFAQWGVDLMIDLEHQSLDVVPGAPDPTARDARGWCRLELRADGSLWAVDVRWTKDGAARLTEKRQRYVSPAFEADPETKRIAAVVNVAITALPATHKTPALVAATRKNSMHVDHVKEALEAIESGDDKKAMDLLKALIAEAAGGEHVPGDQPGSEGDGAEGVAPPKEAKAESPEVVDANAEMYGPGGEHDDMDDEDDEKEPKKKMERKAMRAMLGKITGVKTMSEALLRVAEYKASHVSLAAEKVKLAHERAVMEDGERRILVADLVKLGAEFPATVWADDKAKKLKPRWASMPIAELRAHVADQKVARKGQKQGTGSETVVTALRPAKENELGLTESELAICKQSDCDPAEYARLKGMRDQDNTQYLTALRTRTQNALEAQHGHHPKG